MQRYNLKKHCKRRKANIIYKWWINKVDIRQSSTQITLWSILKVYALHQSYGYKPRYIDIIYCPALLIVMSEYVRVELSMI